MPHLFEPLKIRDVTFKNRIGVSPMCQYSYQNGFSNDWQVVHLGARAMGGVGFVIVEATAVEARGRISPHDLGIWTDDHIEPMRRVTDFLKTQDVISGIQIAHAGRKACTNRPWDGGNPIQAGDPNYWPVVGASAIAFHENYQTPNELTNHEIHDIQKKFEQAALRSLDAGFDFV